MKKALVTGSAGFVGKRFCKKLDELNYDITCIDIVDGKDARDFFRKDNTKYDLVVHLAAVVGGRAKIEGEPLSVAVDLSIDAEAFQWAVRTRPENFVYYSSSAAYPIELQRPGATNKLSEWQIDLYDVRLPDFTYGWSKLTGEVLAKYAQSEGLRVHVFRPFSGYGEDQDTSYPFPAFIQRAIKRENPFEIWGDGTQTRDFIHIEDVVNATLKAVDLNVPGPINLCTGVPTSFNHLAEKIFDQIPGYDPEILHKYEAPVGVHYRVGDPTKLLSFYTPKITLEHGICLSLDKLS